MLCIFIFYCENSGGLVYGCFACGYFSLSATFYANFTLFVKSIGLSICHVKSIELSKLMYIRS